MGGTAAAGPHQERPPQHTSWDLGPGGRGALREGQMEDRVPSTVHLHDTDSQRYSLTWLTRCPEYIQDTICCCLMVKTVQTNLEKRVPNVRRHFCSVDCDVQPTQEVQPTRDVQLTHDVQPTSDVQLIRDVQPTCDVQPICDVQPTCDVQPSCAVQPNMMSSQT